MNVSLPATLKKYVEKRAREGGYSTPSEYMRELIRADLLRREQQRTLDRTLREGLESPGIEATAGFWDELRAEGRARAATRNSVKAPARKTA